MITIFVLLVLYQLKHFFADYPLQNAYMLGKFKSYPDYILPLAAHAGTHAGFTFCIALGWVSLTSAIILALIDFIIHFTMDRIKASPNLLGRFVPLTKETYPTASRTEIKSNTFFWWSLGADQMVHHFTHYLLIWLILLWQK